MTVVDIKSKKVDFVNVVDAEGNPIPGFGSPVPATWIGTHLLPIGAKEDDGEPDESEVETPGQDVIDEAVKAATSELEAKVADLTTQLAAKSAELDAAVKAAAGSRKPGATGTAGV